MKLGPHFCKIVVDPKNDGSKTNIGSSNSKSDVEYVQKNSRFEAMLLTEKMAKN